MLSLIVHRSLRLRGLVIALAATLLGYGLYTLARIKFDVFPEFAPPQVIIQTEAPGLAPEQVEVLVTQPIENAINGVEGIESLRSASIQGLSLITVVVRPEIDLYRARQVVAERLSQTAGQLPQGVKAPVMTPLTSSTSTVLVLGLTSARRSLMDLRSLADWTIKPRLLAVPGVAKVAVFGGEVKQLQVQIRPERLIQYNLAIADVVAAARQATGVRGAGFIDHDNQRLVLQSEGQSLAPEQLVNTVLLHWDGVSVRLGDIAKVVEAPEPPFGAAAIQGQPGVQLVVSEQYGANTLEVTQKIEAALEGLGPLLEREGVRLYPDLFRPANFIETAIGNVQSSLALGAILVVLVLLLFLFDLRTAAISVAAIPLSLLGAVTILESLGLSLNTMTLGGLAIAVGVVVDDAVIDVENIFRRLRENRRLENQRPVFQVIFEASLEVRSPVFYATLAVALVFAPLLSLSGVGGRLFAPLGLAFILAILTSLLVALTVIPALCLVLLERRVPEQEPPLVRWLKPGYRSLLRHIEHHPRPVLGAMALLTVSGLIALPLLGGGFLPELREGHFIIHMAAIPGTSLTESLRLGHQVTLELLKIPSVRSVAQRVGRAEQADDVLGTHHSEFEVDLNPLEGEETEFAEAVIRNVLGQFPGVNFSIKTLLTERIEETLSGYTASVVVNLYGDDLEVLDTKVQQLAQVLDNVPGATEVQMQSPPGVPKLAVRLRQADLERWGVAAVEVLDAIRTAFQGEIVGQIYQGNRIVEVSVILDPEARKNLTDIEALPLRNSQGTYLELGQLADVDATSGRYAVLHNGARRVQTVTCNVAGRDVNAFVSEAKRQILANVSLPAGSYVEFSGTAEAQVRSVQDLIVHSAIAGFAILLLLSTVVGNTRNLLLVLINLPFTLVGGVLAVFITGGWVSLGSLVGFVTLFGITLRNSIMLITHYTQLVSIEGMGWGPETALRGAQERLAPILMTALVTALGLLPLAIGSGDPGREVEGPMAVVILGGLITSTALNLLVLPSLALRYGRFVAK